MHTLPLLLSHLGYPFLHIPEQTRSGKESSPHRTFWKSFLPLSSKRVSTVVLIWYQEFWFQEFFKVKLKKTFIITSWDWTAENNKNEFSKNCIIQYLKMIFEKWAPYPLFYWVVAESRVRPPAALIVSSNF